MKGGGGGDLNGVAADGFAHDFEKDFEFFGERRAVGAPLAWKAFREGGVGEEGREKESKEEEEDGMQSDYGTAKNSGNHAPPKYINFTESFFREILGTFSERPLTTLKGVILKPANLASSTEDESSP